MGSGWWGLRLPVFGLRLFVLGFGFLAFWLSGFGFCLFGPFSGLVGFWPAVASAGLGVVGTSAARPRIHAPTDVPTLPTLPTPPTHSAESSAPRWRYFGFTILRQPGKTNIK